MKKPALSAAPVDRLVGRRLRFLPAFREEIKHWRRLSHEEESMLRMFSACVAMRMNGEDPGTLLEPKNETMVADCDAVEMGRS